MIPTVSRIWVSAVVIAALTIPAALAQTASELNARGAELYQQNRWEEAAEHFKRAFEQEPGNDVVCQNLMNAAMMHAQSLFEKGDKTKAYDWLKLAMRAQPRDHRPINQLGAYYLYDGDVRSAIFRLEEAIELNPGDIESHFLLGMAYYKDNDVTAAIDQWEFVYNKDKSYPGLMDRLEDALREELVEHDFEGDFSRNFKITYDTETEHQQVNDVLEILEEAYREIGRTLGGLYPPTPIQVSLYTAEGFSDSTQQGEHVAALYDGTKIRCPVIDREGRAVPRPILRERLRHEYVHVVVRHAVRERAPWWFNEGLAEVLSSELDSRRISVLSAAAAQGQIYTLAQISPPNTLAALTPPQLELAYAQAHLTMEYLYDNHGARGVLRMFEALNEGLSMDDAIRRSFHMTTETLQSRVLATIPAQ